MVFLPSVLELVKDVYFYLLWLSCPEGRISATFTSCVLNAPISPKLIMDIPEVCLSVDSSANGADFFWPSLAWRRDNYTAGRQSSRRQWVERCTVSPSQRIASAPERQSLKLMPRAKRILLLQAHQGVGVLELGNRALVFQVLCHDLELSHPTSLGLCENKTQTFILTYFTGILRH